MKNSAKSRRPIAIWIALGVIVLSGAFLRFSGITDLGLQGSDNTYYTNIAKNWSEGDRVYCIGENWTLYRPVVYRVFGLALNLFGFDDSSIKIANAAFDTVNIGLVFLLAFLLSRRSPWVAPAAAAVYGLLPFTILISRSEQTHILSTTAVLTASILVVMSWTAETRAGRMALLALSGLATGLSALTHEDLIFTAAGPTLLLFLSLRTRTGTLPTRVLSVLGPPGTYLGAVVLTSFPMLLTHLAEAHQRSSEIVGHRVAQSQYLNFIERPLKYGWNAVNGTGSAILACLVVALVLVLVLRLMVRMVRRKAGWKILLPQVQDLPLWTVAGYLLLYTSFFGYFAARLFVPLIPLVVIWLMVRTADLAGELAKEKRLLSAGTAVVLGSILITANLGHIGAIRSFEFSHFPTWTPLSLSADLRPVAGWSEFRKRLTTPTWARRRFEELGQIIDSDARLLVGASTFHPFPGRRVLQIGYYFGDDAVYLFDHDEPLDQLIPTKNIKFVLFTTHQAYDTRAVEWAEQQRYLYDGKWAPPTPLTVGAGLGFKPGEYSIESEFERLRSFLSAREARIIFGQGELLKVRPFLFTTPSYVVWALDPADWTPLTEEHRAISESLEFASAGQLHKALARLEAAETEAGPLGRFRLQLTAIHILADDHRPDKARRRLRHALSLFPRNTTLCTALREAFPNASSSREMYDFFSNLQDPTAEEPNLRALLTGLAVNIADFALEAGHSADAVDAFHTIEHHLKGPGNRQFTRAVAIWCASRARSLEREGRTIESQVAFTAASTAFRQLTATSHPSDPILLLTAGRAMSDIGQHDEATEVLSRASEADPTNPLIWSNLCLAFNRGGNDEQAFDACKQSLKLAPDNLLASTLTVEILARTDHRFEASDQLLGLLALSVAAVDDAREVDRLHSVAETVIDGLLSDGDTRAAAKVSEALGRFLSDRSRHDAAIATLLQATQLAPDNDNVWANLCLTYQRAGCTHEALESCSRALALNQGHFWARLMSAEILGADGQWPQALKQAHLAADSPSPTGDPVSGLIRLAQNAAESGHHSAACDLLLSIDDVNSEAVVGALSSLDCPATATVQQ